MRKRFGWLLSLALLGAVSAAAPADAQQGSFCTKVSGFCVPNFVLLDPTTGLVLGTSANPLYVQGGTGGGGSSGPAAVTVTQTIKTLVAGTSQQLVAANPTRKSLRWMDVGTNPMTVVPGATAAVAGSGMNYNGGQGAGFQGGSEDYDAGAVPTNAFQAISTAGTTVIVWEGN